MLRSQASLVVPLTLRACQPAFGKTLRGQGEEHSTDPLLVLPCPRRDQAHRLLLPIASRSRNWSCVGPHIVSITPGCLVVRVQLMEAGVVEGHPSPWRQLDASVKTPSHSLVSRQLWGSWQRALADTVPRLLSPSLTHSSTLLFYLSSPTYACPKKAS